MRNVVLTIILIGACGPHPTNPQTTEGDTETLGGLTYETSAGATDGATNTSSNPTTEVNGSTGMPDTDDPVITTLPTTSTTDTDAPPICDNPVMCGSDPCVDIHGNVVCGPEECEPAPCDTCIGAAFCGELDGEEVCIINGEVPCVPCSPVFCEQCPFATCNQADPSICLDPTTGTKACAQDLLFCDDLEVVCTEDAQCGGGAPTCVDGACRAVCAVDEDCGALKSICSNNGICVDAESHPVCAVIPHEPPPPPTCEPNGQCMSDIDCPTGASVCWDFTTQAPVVAGEIGNCVAPCAGPGECAEGDMCATLGFCVNRAMEPTCSPE